MKIRTKLTLRYLFVTALLVIAVFFVLEELLFPQAGYDMLHILNTRLLAVWAAVSYTHLTLPTNSRV